MRHTAAKATSNTTLGYSKGRAVSGATRKPLAAVHAPQETKPRHPLDSDPELDRWIFNRSLIFDDEEEECKDDQLGGLIASRPQVDDEFLDEFQLEALED